MQKNILENPPEPQRRGTRQGWQPGNVFGTTDAEI